MKQVYFVGKIVLWVFFHPSCLSFSENVASRMFCSFATHGPAKLLVMTGSLDVILSYVYFVGKIVLWVFLDPSCLFPFSKMMLPGCFIPFHHMGL